MKNLPYKIILMRHAESIKNVKKIHGGQGEDLTDEGIRQAKEVAQVIHDQIDCGNLKIYTSTSYHTTATAKIIAQSLNLTIEQPIFFMPLNLGIADGLSEDELTKKFPQAQKLFEAWRRREIDIKKLKIPGMEPYMDFWHRGEYVISQLPTSNNILLVCSNSLMILLTHVMLQNHPENTDAYRHISIKNCGLIVFETDFQRFILDNHLTNVDINN